MTAFLQQCYILGKGSWSWLGKEKGMQTIASH